LITGTLLNGAAIIIGSLLGLVLGGRLPERLRQTIVMGMGLFTLAYGVQLFLKTQNTLVVVASIVCGAAVGEWWQIENAMQDLGKWLEKWFSAGGKKEEGRFTRGFLTATLIYCIGPIVILGSIQNGLTGDYSMLGVKSVLDGIYSIFLAATLGIGVMFSAAMILVVQGGISLLAGQIQGLATPAMMNEMSAAGGIILMGIAISSLLEIKKIRAGNLIPALIFAPLFVMLFSRLGIF
jgi:uncharacterized protein